MAAALIRDAAAELHMACSTLDPSVFVARELVADSLQWDDVDDDMDLYGAEAWRFSAGIALCAALDFQAVRMCMYKRFCVEDAFSMLWQGCRRKSETKNISKFV